MNVPIRRAWLAALTSVALAGCQSSSESVLAERGPLIEEIYLEMESPTPRHHGLPGRAGAEPALEDPDAGCQEASPSAEFSRLANPTLHMYVYPHLTEIDRIPIPGYMTSFPMYQTVEMALPGEPTEPAGGNFASCGK